MKRYLLFGFFIAATITTHAQLEEDFDPAPTGWVLSQGASFNSFNGNVVVQTPGVGGNNPANIGTPAVNKTSNTMKVCFDIWATSKSGGTTVKVPFDCNTYADILFVNSAVTTSNDAEKPENIYARQDNYLLPANGGTTCFTFNFPSVVMASDFKVFISFHAGCTQGGTKYIIDNVSISGVTLICGGNNCPPVALNDVFNRANVTEMSFSGALYGSNLNFPGNSVIDATGTDNDQNDAYGNLKWSVLTQPGNGTVTINSNGTFTVTRNTSVVTLLTFTYQLTDDGPDNDFATTADNMTDDATVTVIWPAPGTLPVTLVNFNASRNGNAVTMQWTTNMESNNTGFEVQRSNGNGAYETVGFVGTKATDGNSATPLHYQFKETNNAKGNTYYRLAQVDKDGMRSISTVKGVRGMDDASRMTVYPNPGKSDNINVLFGSSANRNIVITDLNGKVIKQWNDYHDDNMVINGLRTGVYVLIATNIGTTGRLMQKIVVL
ncbi:MULTISPECIES: T9SS type A sorting domain-containing protein [Niastella]|uniref:T9SS type A sorting domain-containing protein n=1 Tax=Niastella soli TaxID=2821487 RepID=A0ABS3YUC7_9BACT|nr:Ig-like domain-containing protein [Niastella soli]MBO9201373.1 T9SS type A sorting domain-containing protein [Niastella soli]